jgi:hypothetical protein
MRSATIHPIGHHWQMMTTESPRTADAQLIACPKCNAQLAFARSNAGHVDECGFEIYRLTCKECQAPLAGIVDPADDTLLLSEIAA